MKKKIKAIILRLLGRKQKKPCYPNSHLPASAAKLITLPRGGKCFFRETFSDFARINEYGSRIYVPRIKFTETVRELKPALLVDIGANIGLSSLSLLQEFPSITKVVGIEAERENYHVLEKNYGLWSENFKQHIASSDQHDDIELTPLWVLASSNKGKDIDRKLSYLPGGLSASGTFAPTAQIKEEPGKQDDSRPKLDEIVISQKRMQINKVVSEYGNTKDIMVVKIDIEGGEEELLSNNVEWLERTAFLTIEVHDRMGVPESSRSLLKRLVEYDFAIMPETDILHCFNRKLLQL